MRDIEAVKRIIETNAGLEAAFEIANCSERIDAMFFGGVDMAAGAAVAEGRVIPMQLIGGDRPLPNGFWHLGPRRVRLGFVDFGSLFR